MARRKALQPQSNLYLAGKHAVVPEPGKKVRLVVDGTVSHVSMAKGGERSASVDVHRVRPHEAKARKRK